MGNVTALAVRIAAIDRWQARGALIFPDVVKVGPEGYIHGYICVRPPCGHGVPDNISVHDMDVDDDGAVVHRLSGYSIGKVAKEDNGRWTAAHASGDKLAGYSTRDKALRQLVDHHNVSKKARDAAQAVTAAPTRGYTCAVPPCDVKVPKLIKPDDLDVHSNGDIVHKPSGYKVGTMFQGGDNRWDAEHAANGERAGAFDSKDATLVAFSANHNMHANDTQPDDNVLSANDAQDVDDATQQLVNDINGNSSADDASGNASIEPGNTPGTDDADSASTGQPNRFTSTRVAQSQQRVDSMTGRTPQPSAPATSAHAVGSSRERTLSPAGVQAANSGRHYGKPEKEPKSKRKNDREVPAGAVLGMPGGRNPVNIPAGTHEAAASAHSAVATKNPGMVRKAIGKLHSLAQRAGNSKLLNRTSRAKKEADSDAPNWSILQRLMNGILRMLGLKHDAADGTASGDAGSAVDTASDAVDTAGAGAAASETAADSTVKSRALHVRELAVFKWSEARDFSAIAIPEIIKIGPEGYIHGYICVRPPCGHKGPDTVKRADLVVRRDGGVVDKKTGYSIGHIGRGANGKYEASHATGHVSKHGDKETAVKALMSYHNRNLKNAPADSAGESVTPTAGVPGASVSALADKLTANSDPKSLVHDMSSGDLTAADQELGRRAAALGMPGKMSRAHTAVQGELKRRGGLPDEDFAGPHHTFPVKDQAAVNHAASLAHHADDPAAVQQQISDIAQRKFPGMQLPASLPAPFNADDAAAGDLANTGGQHTQMAAAHMQTADDYRTLSADHAEAAAIHQRLANAGSSEPKQEPDAGTSTQPPLTGDKALATVTRPSNLTSAEKTALTQYGFSVGYRTVNPYLHHNGQVFDTGSMSYRKATPSEIKMAKSMVSGIDGAFSKAEPLKQGIVVHRGTGNMDDLFGAPGSRVGQSFNSKSYTSTTTVPKARVGNGLQYESKPGKLEIHVPAGSQVLPGNNFEKEVILPRNASFKIVNDETGPSGERNVKLEYVPGASANADAGKLDERTPLAESPVPVKAKPVTQAAADESDGEEPRTRTTQTASSLAVSAASSKTPQTASLGSPETSSSPAETAKTPAKSLARTQVKKLSDDELASEAERVKNAKTSAQLSRKQDVLKEQVRRAKLANAKATRTHTSAVPDVTPAVAAKPAEQVPAKKAPSPQGEAAAHMPLEEETRLAELWTYAYPGSGTADAPMARDFASTLHQMMLGNDDAAKSSPGYDDARKFLQLVDSKSEPQDSALYRGVSLPASAISQLKPGKTTDIPVSSFTKNAHEAVDFSGGEHSAGKKRVVFAVEPGAKGMDISPMQKRSRNSEVRQAMSEHEIVSGGHFQVTRTSTANGITTVHVKQLDGNVSGKHALADATGKSGAGKPEAVASSKVITPSGNTAGDLKSGDRVLAAYDSSGAKPHTVTSVSKGDDGKVNLTLRDDDGNEHHESLSPSVEVDRAGEAAPAKNTAPASASTTPPAGMPEKVPGSVVNAPGKSTAKSLANQLDMSSSVGGKQLRQYTIKKMSTDDLKGVDAEYARRAAVAGKLGKVTGPHQDVRDEITRRGGQLADLSKEMSPADIAAARAQEERENILKTWTTSYRYKGTTEAMGKRAADFATEMHRLLSASKPPVKCGAGCQDAHKFISIVSNEAVPQDKELQRGLTLTNAAADRMFSPGKTADMPLLSWTNDAKVASRYSEGDKPPPGRLKVVLHAAPGTKGMDITNESIWHGESEVVTGGRFTVASTKTTDGIMHVYLTQNDFSAH